MTTPESSNIGKDTIDRTEEATRSSRRLILAGAAAAATTAALATGHRAEAADGEPVLLGRTTNVSTNETRITGPNFTVTDGLNQGSLARTIDGVPSTTNTGVHGYTSGADQSRAVWGQSETNEGVGVYGGHWSRSPGVGVIGQSANGAGVWAQGTSDDLALIGTGRLRFVETQQVGPRTAGFIGTLARNTDGSLWYCWANNRWQQLAGPKTAGGFVPVDPTRVYDSRRSTPLFGKLPSGQNRVLSVAAGRSTTTGAVVDADLVPSGATAITYNLTATGTAGRGFLSVAPGNINTVNASALNWTTSDASIANAGTVKLDSNRRVNVICGGASAATDFIIDVTGYYI